MHRAYACHYYLNDSKTMDLEKVENSASIYISIHHSTTPRVRAATNDINDDISWCSILRKWWPLDVCAYHILSEHMIYFSVCAYRMWSIYFSELAIDHRVRTYVLQIVLITVCVMARLWRFFSSSPWQSGWLLWPATCATPQAPPRRLRFGRRRTATVTRGHLQVRRCPNLLIMHTQRNHAYINPSFDFDPL